MSQTNHNITVGVLALQGAFSEHIQLLRKASQRLRAHQATHESQWQFMEVRTVQQLDACDALIIPGGESTTMSLVAARSGMLEPLREFVKVQRKPTWGTCAGLILLAESANRTKKGGQELIGGLDVRVNRNHFGRQVESFQTSLELPFLLDAKSLAGLDDRTFKTVFIRAPVVEKVLTRVDGIQVEEAARDDTVIAPSKAIARDVVDENIQNEVQVLARLPESAANQRTAEASQLANADGDIVAVRQGNVFGTSFHPELTDDDRIHVWWLEQVIDGSRRRVAKSS